MNLTEAYKILEVPPTISDDDLKKQFKKLAAKYHPDVNKEPDALEKSKSVSEAFNFIKAERAKPPAETFDIPSGHPFGGFSDIFDSVFRGATKRASTSIPTPINEKLEISFSESILGCQKTITYFRNAPCQNCDGEGAVVSANTCDNCNGKGRLKKTMSGGRNGSVVEHIMTCVPCMGTGKQKTECTNCQGRGYKRTKADLKITVPAGIDSDTTLRARGQGNYDRDSGLTSELLIKITVKEEPGLKKVGNDVISELCLSLSEALQGGKREVTTLQGSRWIEIPPLKNSNYQHVIKGFGVAGEGNHIFNITVDFSSEMDKLKNLLSKDNKETDANVNSL